MTSCIHRKSILPLWSFFLSLSDHHYTYHHYLYHNYLYKFHYQHRCHYCHYCISSGCSNNSYSVVSFSSSLAPSSLVFYFIFLIIIIVTVWTLITFISISLCAYFLSKQSARIWVISFEHSWIVLYHAILFKHATTCFPWRTRFGAIQYRPMTRRPCYIPRLTHFPRQTMGQYHDW